MLDHHRNQIIINAGSSLDHHQSWIIINIITSAISIKWCYLSIIIVIGISIEPTPFSCWLQAQPPCRPSYSSALISDLVRNSLPAVTFDYERNTSTIMLERNSQHSHLTMGGAHPPPCQKGLALTSAGVIGHTIYHPRKGSTITSTGIEGHTIYYPEKGTTLIFDPFRKAQHLYLTQSERLSAHILQNSRTHYLLSK